MIMFTLKSYNQSRYFLDPYHLSIISVKLLTHITYERFHTNVVKQMLKP